MTVEEVKEAFDSLYDSLALSRASLCRHFGKVAQEIDNQRRAQAMRSVLLNAIEALQPAAPHLPLTPTLRGYELLSLHYVQRLSLAEAAEELNISPRQAYRDLAQALERVTEYLRELAQRPAEVETNSHRALRDELERVSALRVQVDLNQVIGSALDTLSPLAQAKGITLRNLVSQRLPDVMGEPSLLRQLLLSALSWVVRHCGAQVITLEGQPERGHAAVRIGFRASSPIVDLAGSEVDYLCRALGVALDLRHSGDHTQLELLIPLGKRHLVLVIEDNPAVIEMYTRMLQDTDMYELSSAPTPEAAAAMAESINPDVIILDILMPGQNGWSLLRSLRGKRATRDIPVLVCSVFDEPELAMSLGATEFLRKPVSTEQLVRALESCLLARSNRA